jgi:hypothetical protein
MRIISEYELTKILNKLEINYIQNMKKSSGDIKQYNMNGVYTVREVRSKINKYLNKKYES